MIASRISLLADVVIYKNELQLQTWFKANLPYFGFEKQLIEWKGFRRLTTPDFWCLPAGWRDLEAYRITRVEMELLGQNFFFHGHDPVDCDWVYCAEDNRELYASDGAGIQWLEIGFACDPSRHTRCAALARRIIWYWDAGKGDRAARAAQMLAWWQPEGAGACYWCHREFQVLTAAGTVYWHGEADRHLECLQHAVLAARAYVQQKEAAALDAERRYRKVKPSRKGLR